MGAGIWIADNWIAITFFHLLATPRRWFIEAMTRRTYRLPPNIDRALAQHARSQATTPSAVVRDALATYLAIEGTTHRVSVELDVMRQEHQASLLLLKELTARLQPSPQPAVAPALSDRMRDRFEQRQPKDETDGNGHR